MFRGEAIRVGVCVALALTTWIASLLLGRVGTRSGVKDVAYECGMLPEKGAQPRFSVKFYLVLDGAHYECMVLSPLGAELQRRMPVKLPPDTSKLVMSPMPGLLTKITVKVGEAVTAGQKLASIEAMKMENTLSAMQDGVVAEICAKEGDSLAVDQLIIRFE